MSQGIGVLLLDQTGAKSVRAKISPTVLVKQILPVVITKMLLPVTAPDGTPMSYSLDAKRLGMRLREDKSLAEQGIQEGDVLICYPEITAGAISELWAIIGTNEDDSEGLMGVMIDGVGWMPFVASSQEELAVFFKIAKDASDAIGRPAKTVRFVAREDVGPLP